MAARKIGRLGDAQLLAWNGDITRIAVEAVVVGDNPFGLMVGQVGNAIKREWGAEIEERSTDNGPYEEGSAWHTEAGHRTKVRYVLHAAAMNVDHRSSFELVSRSTVSVLDEAIKLGLSTVAFTAMGTGLAQLAPEECGRAMADGLVRHYQAQEALPLKEIVFVLWGAQMLRSFVASFESELGRLAPSSVSTT